MYLYDRNPDGRDGVGDRVRVVRVRARVNRYRVVLPARRVQRSEGYKWMIVNGAVTFEDNRCTGTTPGKLLRHGF